MPVNRHGSASTKARILEVARRQFAADGYERTTIRSVAAAAEIDPSMVMRYFGSKDGLFAAAASFELRLPDLSSLPQGARGRQLARHFLQLWDDPSTGSGLAILLRAAATNKVAAARVKWIFGEQVLPAVSAVAPDQAETRATLIATQILGMAYCRHVLDFPALQQLEGSRVLSSFADTIQRYLDGPLQDE